MTLARQRLASGSSGSGSQRAPGRSRSGEGGSEERGDEVADWLGSEGVIASIGGGRLGRNGRMAEGPGRLVRGQASIRMLARMAARESELERECVQPI